MLLTKSFTLASRMRTAFTVLCLLPCFYISGCSSVTPAASTDLHKEDTTPPISKEVKYEFTQNMMGSRKKQMIWEALRRFKNKAGISGLEIGSHEGRSAVWLLETILTHPTARLDCVDIFADELGYEKFFDKNIKLSGAGQKVNKYKGPSQIILRSMPLESYDFIYIDGCHLASCAYLDLALSWLILKKDGIMLVDDFLWRIHSHNTHRRPKVAVDAFLEAFRTQIKIFGVEGGVLALRKTRTIGAKTLRDASKGYRAFGKEVQKERP